MVRIEVLEDGEQALLYSYNGHVSQIQGPKRIYLFMSKIQRLERYIAQSDEYLRIEYKNGELKHKMGPCIEFFNKLNINSISVEKCFCLDSNQAIIVYQQVKENNYSKRIVHGPGVFMIEPNEWVHEFSWHGVDDTYKTRYVKDKNKFRILNCAPNQLYYNVDEVRTADDALIRIKLMIFYELKNINQLLSNSIDPIGDFINCCSADVISFCSKRSYMDFIENCHKLNDLENFSMLTDRAKQIGFEISKVVFRGYFASPKLQAMHDFSIKTRTNLKLELESEKQNQESLCYNLKNEINRLKAEQELELEKSKHKNEMEKINIINKCKIDLSEKSEKIELESKARLQRLEQKEKLNQIEIEKFKDFASLRVNLTDYLLTSLAKPEKTIQISKGQSKEYRLNELNLKQPKLEIPKIKSLLKIINNNSIKKSLKENRQSKQETTNTNSMEFFQPSLVQSINLWKTQEKTSQEEDNRLKTYHNLKKLTRERFNKNLKEYLLNRREEKKFRQIGYRFPVLNQDDLIINEQLDRSAQFLDVPLPTASTSVQRGLRKRLSESFKPTFSNSLPNFHQNSITDFQTSRRSYYLADTNFNIMSNHNLPKLRSREIKDKFSIDEEILRDDSLFWSRFKNHSSRRLKSLIASNEFFEA